MCVCVCVCVYVCMYIYTTPIDIFGIDTGISEFLKNLIQVSEFEENSKVEVRQKYQ